VRYRPIPDDTVKLQSLQAGEIDVIDYVQPRDVAAVKADKNLVTLDVPVPGRLRVSDQPDASSVQREGAPPGRGVCAGPRPDHQGVWLNVGTAANGPIPPTSWAYDRTITPIKRDLAKAKAKLAEGGKPGGFPFTITTANIPINVQEAEVIQAQLGEAGMQVKIKLVDAATQLSDGNSKNFDMISYQWSGRPDPDGNIYQFFKTTPGTVAQLVGHLQPAGRRAARQDARGLQPARAEEALQRADQDPPGRAAHGVHRASHRAQGVQSEGAGLRAHPGRMMRFKEVWLK
jgi:peptide/nickel transport system substrate-binding protein